MVYQAVNECNGFTFKKLKYNYILQVKNVSIQESLNTKSADIELYDGNNGGDICADDVCGGDVDNYGW